MKPRLLSLGICLASLLLASCTTSSHYVLPYKEWHVSPPAGSEACARIPTVSWNRVQSLYLGMSEGNAMRNLNVLPSNAIYKGNILVWSITRGDIPIEVSFQLSADGTITDISYRQR